VDFCHPVASALTQGPASDLFIIKRYDCYRHRVMGRKHDVVRLSHTVWLGLVALTFPGCAIAEDAAPDYAPMMVGPAA